MPYQRCSSLTVLLIMLIQTALTDTMTDPLWITLTDTMTDPLWITLTDTMTDPLWITLTDTCTITNRSRLDRFTCTIYTAPQLMVQT